MGWTTVRTSIYYAIKTFFNNNRNQQKDIKLVWDMCKILTKATAAS